MKLIVTRPDGSLVERDRVRTHDSILEAHNYGNAIYGFARFVIKRFAIWRKTRMAHREIIRHQIFNRWNKFKNK